MYCNAYQKVLMVLTLLSLSYKVNSTAVKNNYFIANLSCNWNHRRSVALPVKTKLWLPKQNDDTQVRTCI